mgnify:CR=1 FL=1
MANAKYYGTGRRKKSIARVYLVPGTGKITINKRDIDEYLGLETLKVVVRQPLAATDNTEKFDVLVNVHGGGFTGTRGARDQHQPGPHVGEFLDHGGHAQLFQRGDLGGNETENGSQAVLLPEVVAAEAGGFIHFIGKVQVPFFQVFLEGLGITDFREKVFERLAFQVLVGNGGNSPVDADFWRLAFAEVKVGAAGFYEIFKVLVDNSHNRSVSKLKVT